MAGVLCVTDETDRFPTVPEAVQPSLVRALLRLDPRSAYVAGLVLCGLLEELQDGKARTLLVPTNAALDQLPWPLSTLYADDEYTDRLFDVFEYSVLEGHHDGHAPSRARSLQGQDVVLSHGRVHGASSSARILQTVAAGSVVIHAIDRPLLPYRDVHEIQ
jgi:uncharacterized surface protein with fasciclin (FAS1) repeats